MVRAVIGDETHVEGFIDSVLQSGTTLQVGLAVGRLGTGSGRDTVFALIPTPQNEGNKVVFLEGESNAAKEGDKRKGTKGKSATQSLQIDMVWVAEHARQVSKMLVGGIRVVGCYILASEDIFKSSTALLWQTSKMVASAVDAGFQKLSPEDLLLLHFSYSPRRVSCRNCSFESGFGTNALRPCEWKSARTFSTLRSIGCIYNFESRVPIYANKPSKKRLYDNLLCAISAEASRLESALVLSDRSLSVEQVVEDKALIGDTDREVEIFLPFDYPAEVRNGEVTGLVILSGSIWAQAYGFSRDPLSRAVTDLKADILKSLRSRLEILFDEVEETFKDAGSATEATEGSLHPLQRMDDTSEFRCKLPRRLLIPWLERVSLCDYLQEGESLQDITGRCKELLGVDDPLDQSKIVEHEGDVVSLMERSFWDVPIRSASDTKIKQGKTQGNEQRTTASNAAHPTLNPKTIGLVSFLVLLVSIIASYLVTIRSRYMS
eukprot:c16336_g1_i1 orf=165-1637(-)